MICSHKSLKKMDAATADRINTLAKNLREMKIATSMEDALQKAREIVLGIEGKEQSVNQYNEEKLLRESEKAAAQEEKMDQQAEKMEQAVAEVKEEATKDALNNQELQNKQQEVSDKLRKERAELDKIKAEVEAAKAALEAAKQKQEDLAPQVPPTQDIPQSAPAPEKKRATLTEDEKKKTNLSDIFNFQKR